ncbi:RNA polymerase subunit sigma [Leptotrichia sp. oral taxon 847]|nr:RNA polymerase subunit sigma [Leptotrichia sp. oral taxon 847]AMD95511.1 RNA polymerase subunit sigma [Leptotrichia sp. oral taxon 847]
MLNSIMEDIRKKGKFSFEKVVENNDLSDDEFFEFLKFIYLENIPEVRTSVDGNDFIVLENEDFYVLEKSTIKSYLEDIKSRNKEIFQKIKEKKSFGDDELIDRYLKVAVKESLVYSKFGFSFLDIVQEATLGLISGLSYYPKIMETSKEPEFFLKNFSIKYILEFQKKLLKNIKSMELSYILYLKLKLDKAGGYSVEEISKQMNVNPEYLEDLEKLFDDIKDEKSLESEKIFEKADKITKMYILENIPKKLSYIDEQILVMFYGLDDKIYSEKEIAKALNIGYHNVNILKEKALNKLSIDMLQSDFIKNSENLNFLVN